MYSTSTGTRPTVAERRDHAALQLGRQSREPIRRALEHVALDQRPAAAGDDELPQRGIVAGPQRTPPRREREREAVDGVTMMRGSRAPRGVDLDEPRARGVGLLGGEREQHPERRVHAGLPPALADDRRAHPIEQPREGGVAREQHGLLLVDEAVVEVGPRDAGHRSELRKHAVLPGIRPGRPRIRSAGWFRVDRGVPARCTGGCPPATTESAAPRSSATSASGCTAR
ncbi:MAG TPA: hypothetical protein VK631_13255 [Solirubrobacteraceae bacterium]|nr:hypothetical protein [Solirubrobacteraceae bacterium]